MLPSLRSTLAILLLLSSHIASAQTPRERVEAVAVTIQANYYDAARGEKIAADLRARAEGGEFDPLVDARDLASRLSQHLEPMDGHFNVSWSEPTAHVAAPPTREQVMAQIRSSERRENYGVRRVEILPGNVGYMDLRLFSGFEFGRDDQPARKAIEAALQLLSTADALIIDLRDSPGGQPEMVGYLISAFTPKGADIYNDFHDRQGDTISEAPAEWYPAPRLETPLYLLTSGRTGSAAESFAYTLKSAGRATIVGERSAGAANPGGQLDAGHGMQVFVPSGTPISPITGTNWEGTGVLPDVDVTASQSLDSAYSTALQAIVDRGLAGGRADAAQWTLEALRAQDARLPAESPDRYVGNYGPISIGTEDGRLVLRRDRRPAWQLAPLGNGVFTAMGDPTRRVVFEFDASGMATALEIRFADSGATRYRR